MIELKGIFIALRFHLETEIIHITEELEYFLNFYLNHYPLLN